MNSISFRLLWVMIPLSTINFSIGLSSTVVHRSEEIFELENYIVTGSNFTDADLIFEPPRTVIDNEALRMWGNQSAYTALLDQPFSYGYANSDTQSNGLTGSAGANLRGLGNLSTLTLINGRRAGGNSALGFEHGGFADLNLIPVAAIRQIEVAVDGTSVIYGSDAVGGSINLLLYDDFIGNRVDASYSNTTNGDAAEKNLTFLTGQKLNENTQLVLMGSWYERNAIFARDRKISGDADFSAKGGTDQRSDTFPGRISLNGQPLVLDGVTFPTSINDYTLYTRESDGFNYNKYAPAIPALEQASIMANTTYQLCEQIEFWTELLYTKTEFYNALAPAPWTTVQLSNSFPGVLKAVKSSPHRPNDIPENDIDSLSYRNLELGNLKNPSEKEAHRILFGIRGEIDRWNWETAAMQIQTTLDREFSGIVDRDALIERTNSGFFNPFAMAFASGTNNGVFFDNATALKEAATTTGESFKELYRSIDFKIEGPVFELPTGEVRALLGTQYSEEEIDIKIDSGFLFPGIPGASSTYSPYEAERTVFSFFGESIVPLLGNHNSGTKLKLQLAVRYDGYTDESDAFENTYNQFVYKTGVEFIPINSITINGSFSTAFRAPTLNESFNTNYASLVYNTGTEANPVLQRFTTELGANPDLEPEKSHIFNLGIVYEPEFAPGLSAGVNYYRITTRNAINNNGQALVDAGASGFIVATRFNTASVLTDGLEYEIAYRHESSYGLWEASVGINQVLGYEIKPNNDAQTVDFLGRLVHPLVPGESVQGPGSIPEFKGYARLVWNRGGLTLGGTIHYIHSLEDNAIATIDGASREIEPRATLDLVAQYSWAGKENRWLSGTTLTLGIENVSDEAPPFAAGAFADGYDSSLYSLEGRRISLSLSKVF